MEFRFENIAILCNKNLTLLQIISTRVVLLTILLAIATAFLIAYLLLKKNYSKYIVKSLCSVIVGYIIAIAYSIFSIVWTVSSKLSTVIPQDVLFKNNLFTIIRIWKPNEKLKIIDDVRGEYQNVIIDDNELTNLLSNSSVEEMVKLTVELCREKLEYLHNLNSLNAMAAVNVQASNLSDHYWGLAFCIACLIAVGAIFYYLSSTAEVFPDSGIGPPGTIIVGSRADIIFKTTPAWKNALKNAVDNVWMSHASSTSSSRVTEDQLLKTPRAVLFESVWQNTKRATNLLPWLQANPNIGFDLVYLHDYLLELGDYATIVLPFSIIGIFAPTLKLSRIFMVSINSRYKLSKWNEKDWNHRTKGDDWVYANTNDLEKQMSKVIKEIKFSHDVHLVRPADFYNDDGSLNENMKLYIRRDYMNRSTKASVDDLYNITALYGVTCSENDIERMETLQKIVQLKRENYNSFFMHSELRDEDYIFAYDISKCPIEYGLFSDDGTHQYVFIDERKNLEHTNFDILYWTCIGL